MMLEGSKDRFYYTFLKEQITCRVHFTLFTVSILSQRLNAGFFKRQKQQLSCRWTTWTCLGPQACIFLSGNPRKQPIVCTVYFMGDQKSLHAILNIYSKYKKMFRRIKTKIAQACRVSGTCTVALKKLQVLHYFKL